MSEFPLAWQAGLQGGLLIGLAAALLFALTGKIAGVSGLVATAWRQQDSAAGLARAFIVGMLVAGLLAAYVLKIVPAMLPNVGLPTMVVAGLLVGFGTRLGNGCTSGHGVCGISRLSWRSLIATVTFMAAGMVTVAILRAGSV